MVILGFIFVLFNFQFSESQITLISYQYFLGYSNESETIKQIALIDDCARLWANIYYGIGFFISYSSNRIFRKSASDFIQNIKGKFLYNFSFKFYSLIFI